MNNFTVFDIESNGLLDTITKIHCLSYSIYVDGKLVSKGSITNYDKMRAFLKVQMVLVGHNIVLFDVPALERILGIKITCKLVDTLGLSWYLYPLVKRKGKMVTREKHGLGAWGELLGFPKPPIEDWHNLPVEEYVRRCESDVEINTRLWLMMRAYLKEIYEGDYERIVGYLTFKLECAREQEEEFCYIDRKKCNEHLNTIMMLIEEKVELLSEAMPEKITYKEVIYPSKFYKKDGSISVAGEKWLELCDDLGLSKDHMQPITVEVSRERGNPGSSQQLKEWLFSLGWEPENYKDSTSKVTGITKQVPQVSTEGKICKNLKGMFADFPFLENIEGLTILSHRKGVFEGFLNSMDSENRVQAKIAGFTNTLRIQHRKPIANLTKVGKPWGKEIRGVITVPNDDYVLCGSDMSALEDTTKQHYMYPYDKDYVINMRVKGFDPHLDIAEFAGLMVKDQSELFKQLKYRDEELKEVLTPDEKSVYFALGKLRSSAKTVNFAAVYGAGPAKIAKTLKCTFEFAQKLHEAYWKRNYSVKLIAKDATVKTINNQMWLYNPVSGFWYTLRFDKDRFSTLNQGTGVYCFDSWLRRVRSHGLRMMLQYHDEIGFRLLKGQEKNVERILKLAVEELNEEVKLNVPLGVSVQFGNDYSSIH